MSIEKPQIGEPFNHKGQYAILDVVERMSISSTCKRVYRKLFTYKNEAFPRHKTLAEDLGISHTTARRCVVLLEKAGLVRRCSQNREDGGQTSNRVEILYHDAFKSVYKLKNEHPPVHSGSAHISSPQLVSKPGEETLTGVPQIATAAISETHPVARKYPLTLKALTRALSADGVQRFPSVDVLVKHAQIAGQDAVSAEAIHGLIDRGYHIAGRGKRRVDNPDTYYIPGIAELVERKRLAYRSAFPQEFEARSTQGFEVAA